MSLPAALLMMASGVTAPVQVMVLGTYHFGNPGRDRVNVRVDDVTTPERQREIAALASAIETFRPTKVMVEVVSSAPTYDVNDYAGRDERSFGATRQESDQIAYRVALRMRLPSVQGIDVQPKTEEEDYFPIGKVDRYAKDHGSADKLKAAFGAVQAEATRTEAKQRNETIPASLIRYNDPSTLMGGQDLYYSLLRFGDGNDQPGADLNARWYLRNAKIFSKLVNVAVPGDRILVVFGSGHGYWLRHFAANTPGYVSVDPRPYLRKAVEQLGETRSQAKRR